MPRDILFDTEDGRFSYRVGGLLIRENKVLLQRAAGEPGYAVIGGHAAFFETNAETLKREFLEEIHAPIAVGELLALGEIFFPWNGPCHQIFPCYRVQLTDEAVLPLTGIFHGFDELGGERFDVEFCWVPFEELRQGAPVYPPEIVPVILGETQAVAHFVYNELE